MFKRTIYYFMIFLAGILYSQDTPSEFEYDQSTAQAFYLFENFQILDIELDPDDWIGVFNIYDETLNGECSTDEINFDETNGGMCYVGQGGAFECTPGFPNCNPEDCSEILDINGDGLLSECACPDIDGDGFVSTQNIEVAVGARRYGDCINARN